MTRTGTEAPSSILIEDVQPQVDCGRYPVKREVGDRVDVSADIFRDGHDAIAAVLQYRTREESAWREEQMRFIDNDRWGASFEVDENTTYHYRVEAFPNHVDSWQDEIDKKLGAGLDVASELLEGLHLFDEIASRASGDDLAVIEGALVNARAAASQQAAVDALRDAPVRNAARRNLSRVGRAVTAELDVTVDRIAARFAAWYSMFPRSAGTVAGQSATFHDVENQLPRIAGMGFDVLYFTPIHPISKSKRKGRNNSLISVEGDPGVPYAIGSDEGGHDAIHPDLGTLDDFRHLVDEAARYGMEIALDVALQGSPEHPWLKEHPDWFYIRPDGTIKFGENPPKKYEDMYPINFQSDSWREIWDEMLRIIRFWVDYGVKTFRVDNPHTKPTAFWEWLISEVHKEHPEVIFLSEAFTRPKVMKALAKAGFAQSYTYFTWRNFKQELREYGEELTQTEMKNFFRANFFTNTHDILPPILQEGGPAAFKFRLVLAATMSSAYGIYSGYELCENTPVPGREEYLNSEKYEYKVWDWDRPGNITAYVSQVNAIR
ncbi:MAG: alpha-1,4-glucan--maltose-1-phosphate maltosyltransferase, partial [Chloroflexota bacterium]|nr:alpha-1,4-glucan--maltose-1-phosphate maltosyltransferase [Chloroflexota bacterium]